MALGEVGRVVGFVKFEALPADGCWRTGEMIYCGRSGDSETAAVFWISRDPVCSD